MNGIEENEFTAGVRDIAAKISKPKAVLCMSAHWETRGTYVTAMEKPKTIHDFFGFPELLYEVQYPASGSPDLAKELSALRTKGVLIVGSGNMVHNLGMVAWDNFDTPGFGYDWAIEASERMKKYILNDEHQQLINYQSQGRAFDLAIPTPEHYLPLLSALALKEEDEKITLFKDKPVAGSLTMTSLKID